LLTQEARQQLEATVKSSPVVLFMKGNPAVPQCGFSRAAVQILELHGVLPEKLVSFDVLEDSSLRNDIKEFSYVSLPPLRSTFLSWRSEWPTIPQIYVNGEFVGGCDILLSSGCFLAPYIAQLTLLLVHQSGELEKLLVEEKIIPPASEGPTSQ
jgi:monothiol glutaredoxin